MTCRHEKIRTWVFEDTEEPSGLWSCVDCGLKFEPITQREWVGLTDEEFQYCVELKNPESIAEEVEAKLKEKNT